MEDSCLKRTPKVATGISVFLLEELGDARLRCAQLKKYVDDAVQLVEKSADRDHIFEVAGHLLHGIPDVLLRMDKALSAAAMAAARLDYEEIKEDLRPEKVDELENALEEVRIRRVQRRSKEARTTEGLFMGHALEAFRTVILPRLQHETVDALDQAVADAMIEFARMRAGNPTSLTKHLDRFKPLPDLDESEWVDYVEEAMEGWFSSMKKTLSVRQASENPMVKIPEVVAQLEHLAASVAETGRVDTVKLASLIGQLEGSTRTASAASEIAGVLHSLAENLVASGDQSERPSRVVLAATLRRVLADTMDVKIGAQGFSRLTIRNREHGSGVKVEDFHEALLQAAENYFVCRGTNRDAQQAVTDALTGRIARIGPLTGMPDAIIQRAEKVKKEAYELDHAMGAVSNDYEVLVRDMKRATPEADRYDKTADEEAKRSRFEEGKPADPTENMSPEDAKDWKAQKEEHKDEFKAATTDEKRSRFEEGKPADPTENMSPEDAKDWKEQKEEHKDEFKTADEEAKRSRFEEGQPADPTENMDSDDAKKWKEQKDEHKDEFKAASNKTATGPAATGSGWKEINDGRGHRWVWDDGTTSFHVVEFPGPGTPLFRLSLITDFGQGHIGPLTYRRQLKTPEEMFAIAGGWFKNIDSFRKGDAIGIDFTGDWRKA